MVDRIRKIMQEDGINSATFAEKIKVDRATISHLFNGRANKPSAGPSRDVLIKILETYETINPDWLLLGKEPMHRKEKSISMPDLFDENPINPVNNADVRKEAKEIEVKTEEIKPKETIIQEIIPPIPSAISKSRKIDKIMILYSDNTFESFSPDK